jgi:dipeptidyl-peptidase-4
VHGGAVGGDVLVTASTSMAWPGTRYTVVRGGEPVGELASFAARPGLNPRARFWVLGERGLRTLVLHPRAQAKVPDGPVPVLLDPYGGPHAQRVVRARNAHLTSQWFADQGFAVVVVDGRGTPARGPVFERAVWGDLAGPVLDDQVDALLAAAERDDRLDLSRVGIRGWSFGGYLAALAVLRRPDVFHAAVAGAPVTDWRLYDTHYTERYLGHPDEHPRHYERTSLLGDAAKLCRPLLLIHGLADDNVVSAHTFQLSSALLAHGRPHQVLPLSGVTHMTPQEIVAENLLRLQVDFLRGALAGAPAGEAGPSGG